ncbi:MAG: tRNA (guanine(10)-N(2))-dimethyltransferase [Candidatus Nanohaloarchaea archaeon]
MEERGYQLFAPEEDEPTKDSEVFFNDKMLHNRDLSAIAGKVFRQKIDTEIFTAADPLSGSGIRGFRYAEIADELYLNDANPKAVKSIKKGLEHNNIQGKVSNEDANVFLSEHRNHLNLIDIDPFGPFVNFLDSTARAANYQSFVGLTATDNSAASGSYPTVCRRRYGSRPLKNSFMHETALRIYIKEAFENFARYDKCFEPRISFQERHYSRIMGRVTESKKRTNRTLDNIGHLSFCPDCRWRKLDRIEECPVCGSETDIAGPLWTGKISDQRFTSYMLEEMPEDWENSYKLLKKIDSEAEILKPFYDIHSMSSDLGIQVPKSKEVIEAIRERGYPVSKTHLSPTGFRTDAPHEDIQDILREVSGE